METLRHGSLSRPVVAYLKMLSMSTFVLCGCRPLDARYSRCTASSIYSA